MQPDNRGRKRWHMKRGSWAIALLLILGANIAWLSMSKRETVAEVTVTPTELPNDDSSDDSTYREPIYQRHNLENATVHVVTVPVFAPLSIQVADDLKSVAAFAEDLSEAGTPPKVVLNAGFFDPNNAKTTSHIVIDGQSAGDPAENEGLTSNPKMQPYLAQIFNRSEFRVYDCPLVNMLTPYAIAAHNDPVPDGCNLVQSIGAGPQLLPTDTSEQEAFTQYENGDRVRDAIGSVYPNARSAVGIHKDGSAVLMMVAQRLDAPGMTLAEVATFAESLGVTNLLNLDGGSSASLHVEGDLHLGRLNSEGVAIERPVKSVIVVE